MKMKKWTAVLLAAVIGLVSLAAMAEELPDDTRPQKDAPVSVTVGNTTRVSGSFFTTQFGNNTSDIDVRAMIHGYDPVVWNSQLGYEADPQVVAGIEKSATSGATIYRVTLQKDLRWNDGTPITAEDYVFSYLLLASPEFADLGADTGAWAHVSGYEEYATGKTTAFAGINLVDKYTFSVTVKAEYEPYFYEYSYLAVYPYPISVIAPGCRVVQTGDGAMIADAQEKEPVRTVYSAELLKSTVLGETGYLHTPQLTAGPYRLTGYDAATGEVSFEKNEYYKGNSEGVKPWIDEVKLVPVTQASMIDDLKSGKVDVLNKAANGEVIQDGLALSGEGYSAESYPRLGYGYLAFACEQGPQQSVSVRQAIAYCFDADAFCTEILKEYGLPVYGCYGLGQWMTMAAAGTMEP